MGRWLLRFIQMKEAGILRSWIFKSKLGFPDRKLLVCAFTMFSLTTQKSFQILSMDDFHNINTVKTPTERILTNAVHMATLLLDTQPSVDAVPRPVNPANMHTVVMVTIPGGAPQLCRGGISSNAVVAEIRRFWPDYSGRFFLESLPQAFKEINLCTVQQSLKELR